MDELVEAGLEASNHLVDKHFDKGWDKYRNYRNGKKGGQKTTDSDNSDRKTADRDRPASPSASDRRNAETPAASAKRSSADFSGGAPLTGVAAYRATSTTASSAYPGSRRRQRNQLPSPEPDIQTSSYPRDSERRQSQVSDRILREYEQELDDPKRKPESVLSSRDLRHLDNSRRDSAMASGYNDGYAQSRYDDRPRSQATRSRYDDDGDSDYDERSGRRYRDGRGRGYDDDRDYDRIIEETERYRGPPLDRSADQGRRSGEGPYGSGAMTRYGRRSEGALDRQEDSHLTRRTKSRGRGDRDRSYSGSRSRSRSRSEEGIREKIEGVFDTSGRGLGVGLAGAIAGGLAGRQFGQKHRERDILIGAIVGGLGANAAENKWREWKDDKERDVRREEGRLEAKWDGRDYGRSRSNVR